MTESIEMGDKFISMCNTTLMRDMIEKLEGRSYGEGIGTLMGALAYMIDTDENLSTIQKMAMVHSISQTLLLIMVVKSSDENTNEQVH